MCEDWIYKTLKINELFARYIQNKAKTFLELAKQNTKQIETIKYLKKFSNSKFDKLYAASRPLNRNSLVNKAGNIQHWSIKLEGKQYLTQIGYFKKNGTQDIGIFQVRFMLNTQMCRKLFWYWYESDDINDKSIFTKRWQVLESMDISRIKYMNGELIAKICENGMKHIININYFQIIVKHLWQICLFDSKKSMNLRNIMDHRIITQLNLMVLVIALMVKD